MEQSGQQQPLARACRLDENDVTGSTVFDVRSIANFVLDVADSCHVDVSNMALNKIIFFVHCDHLIETNQPLVGARIEAWEHGPIFREIYQEFKSWNDAPVRGRATRVDPNSGEVVKAHYSLEPHQTEYLTQLVMRYLRFTAAQLRAISHRVGGPWQQVWGHEGRSNPGMKISNELILMHYSPGVRQ